MCALVDSWLSGLKRSPILNTKRLILRPICVGDVSHIQSGISDERVGSNLSYTPHPYTIEMAENWVRNINHGMTFDNCCYWTICDLTSGRFIGSMGLSLYKEQEGGEIHYWISANEWNKGYCSEAAKRAISYFFEDLKMHRLLVTHREGNLASKTVVKKCGFVLEGIQRDGLKRFDKFENVVTYSLLANEYLVLKEKGVY